MDLLTSVFSTKAGVRAGVVARGCSVAGATSTIRTVSLRTVLTVSETAEFWADLVRAVGGWRSRGLKQRRIGHGDVGRDIACPGRDDGGSVDRSLIGAFIGENGFGHNASERAVGLWLQ